MLKVWCIQNSYLLAQPLTTVWHCETPQKLKAQFWGLFPHMEQPLLQHDCQNTYKCKTTEIQLLGLTILDHPPYCPWLGTVWHSCLPSWKNILEDNTICQMMKPGQQLHCGSVIKCTMLWWRTHKTTWTVVKACRLQRWLCGEITV
jgi:hypothetical protein